MAHRLIESFGGDFVQASKVRVEHDLLPANEMYLTFNGLWQNFGNTDHTGKLDRMERPLAAGIPVSNGWDHIYRCPSG